MILILFNLLKLDANAMFDLIPQIFMDNRLKVNV